MSRSDFAVLQDLDNCLIQTTEQILIYGQREYDLGRDFPFWEFHEYEIEKNIPEFHEEHRTNMFCDPLFWDSIPLYPEALDFNHRLYAFYKIHIVTDRRWYPELEQQTRDYLDRAGFYYDSLTICKGKEKGAWAAAHGIDFAIEDSLKNALLLEPVCHTALINQPWNQFEIPEQSCLTRIDHRQETSIDYEELLRQVIRADIQRESRRRHYVYTGEDLPRIPLRSNRRPLYARAA